MHSKKLSEAGIAVRSTPPLCAQHIIEHAKSTLEPTCEQLGNTDRRDVELHAFLLTAMSCRMRYDELS